MTIFRYIPPETLTESAIGFWSGGYHEEYYYPTVSRGMSARANVVHSDHKTPTWYSREEVWVSEDKPYVTHERDEPNPGEVRADLIRTRYISPRVGAPEWWGYPADWNAAMGNAEDMAVTRARERLRGQDTFNIGVAVAEARNTAELLADKGSQAAKALINFRRYADGLRKGREAALAAAGAWLSGYYGWGSLGRDIWDLDNSLRSKKDKPLLINANYTARVNRDYSEGGTWNGKSEWRGLVKVGYKAKIISEFFRNADQWGLMNPAEILWERMPYSFCVDWLIPVGNTLSSLSATAGLEFESGYMSTVSSFNYTRTYTPLPWEELLSGGVYTTHMKRFDRKALSGFLPPRLYANENPFNTNRIASAVALITQAVFGRGGR